MRSMRNKHRLWAVPVVLLLVAGAGALTDHRQNRQDLHQRAEALTGGNIEAGERAFLSYGCGGCHKVGGTMQAQGRVGPTLDGIGRRAVIGGRLENKPENMMRWIVNPQNVSPGTAMPNLDVTPAEARDISAFLYSRS